MGRAAAPWLQRAYDICADGRWHLRDVVLDEMAKLVPPAVAYRRGVATTKTGLHNLSERQLIERGARHRCLVALAGSKQLHTRTRDGQVFLRRAGGHRPPVPIVLEASTRKQATHALVPIEFYRELPSARTDVQFVALLDHPLLTRLTNRSDR